MRLVCPSCKTTFELPAKKAKAGKKVRCARCATVFRVPEASGGPASEAGEGPKAHRRSDVEGARGQAEAQERTAWDDLQAATQAEDATPWGEPDLDDGAPLAGGDLYAGPVAAPFSEEVRPGVEADVRPEAAVASPDAEPVPEAQSRETAPAERSAQETAGAGAESEGAERRAVVGRSAIRAQSGVAAVADAGAAEAAEAAGSGWILRTSDGHHHRFEGMDEVHAYLERHPDPGAEVSPDGRTWQDPAALRTMEAPRIPRPEPAGLSVALRSGSAAVEPEGAGLVWGGLALLSTLAMLASVLVALQTLGVVDLSGWVPFEALGLSAIAHRAPPSTRPAAAESPEVARHHTYETLMAEATRFRKAGRLVDAAVSFRRASEVLESPEALEALAQTYETLGETSRARSVRQRLAALRARRGQHTP